ncbi:MAG: lipoyl synthase [Candidatus Omnitrophica bacterium]|nr:lipoyl synthase [Candidatus Omnitrophota bacterium]
MEQAMRKPFWLNKKIDLNSCRHLKEMLRDLRLHSVCEQSLCPNISECFSRSVATFMILGDVCTRNCNFCSVKKGRPTLPDYDEPQRIKKAAERLDLNYVVITSPTRDDLCDGGASLFVETAQAVKSISSKQKVEVLIPDFKADKKSLMSIATSCADVIGHNLETVPSLYKKVRSDSSYRRSLSVLETIKLANRNVFTRSGLMLGFGERDDEVIGVMQNLREVNCDFLNLGQYLSPSLKHHPVIEYVPVGRFDFFKKQAYSLGFRDVKSSPYVRSSYLACTSIVNSKTQHLTP